jgi:putative addiction module component (TIGR02574 family)
MSIADIPQLQNLTDEEKLLLIDELWDSLSPTSGTDEELDRLLAERIAHADAHPESLLTLEEFKRRWAEMRR